MKPRISHRTRGTSASGIVVALFSLLLSGCSAGLASNSSGTQTPAEVDQAKALVATQQEVPKTALALPALGSAASLKGKSIAYISSGLSFPFSQEVLSGVQEGAEVLGMEVTVADTKGDPSVASSQIDRAVSQRSEAIVLQGTDPNAVKAAIAGAREAKIPVLSVAALPESAVPAELANEGVRASVNFSAQEQGKRLADFVVADSGGNAKVGIIGSSTFPISAATIEAFKTELHRLCPGCSTVDKDSPLPQWQTTLQSLSASTITANPELNYLFPLVDAMAPPVKAAIATTGAGARVKVVTLNASIGNLQAIASGKDPEAANVGGPNEQMGWAVADQVGRLLTGLEPVAAEIPLRTFTKDNSAGLDFQKGRATFFGSYDYRAEYKKIWGIG